MSEGVPEVLRAADGSLVAYADLGRGVQSDLRQLITLARTVGLDAIWVTGHLVDASLGFTHAGGLARLEAPEPLKPIELSSPPPAQIPELQTLCFEGIWGHIEPTRIDSSRTFVGLHEDRDWVGICEIDTVRRCILDPGVRRGLRTPDRYARLVRGAANCFGPGPVALETRGDSEAILAAYKELGYALVEYIPGWQLNLKPRRGSLPI